MAYDSDNIPLVTRIESGNNTNVNFSVNSEGEGVYVVNSDVDSDFVKNVISENPAPVDSDTVLSMIIEHAGTGVTGNNVTLETPSDGSLSNEIGIININNGDTVTDAIDRLNEASRNVLKNTAVTNLNFVADNLRSGLPLSTTLTTSADGNPNRFDIYWGDGSIDSDSSDSTPSHTYTSDTGSPYTVRVVARNNNGEGAGSFAVKERSNYIVVFTATPVVNFAIYAASSGGSPITNWDDGATVYLQNNTTNTSNATATYNWNFGDSDGVHFVSNDQQPGGSVLNGGSRLPYTFDTVTEIDRSFNISLTLNTHTTANPDDLPIADSDNTYKIYDTHTPVVSIDDNDGINEEATSGHVVQATNNSGAGVGSFSDFGNRYEYVWGDGSSNTVVNAGSGSAGDRGASPVTHTYTLSSSDQANGNTVTYNGVLRITSSHSSSPFSSSTFTITVRPDLRVNFSLSAIPQTGASDRTGDTVANLYKGVDYRFHGNPKRTKVNIVNTSQNVTNYFFTRIDSETPFTRTQGAAGHEGSGTVGGSTMTIDFDAFNAGTYNLRLIGTGSPGGVAQSDSEVIVVTLEDPPTRPSFLAELDSDSNLTLLTAHQGISARLAHFQGNDSLDRSGDFTFQGKFKARLPAGTTIGDSKFKRFLYDSDGNAGTWSTNKLGPLYDGSVGYVRARLGAGASGSSQGLIGITTSNFTTSIGENGTYDSVIVSNNADAHDTISADIYPTGFYQTFDVQVSRSLSNTGLGLHCLKIETSYGNSHFVHLIKDPIIDTPEITNAGTISVGNAGSFRYISGIPYFNSGSPTISVAGIAIKDLVSFAYTDVSNIVEIDSGTNQESTSASGTVNSDYTYSDIDGASSFLDSETNIPIFFTGTTYLGTVTGSSNSGSPYTIGTLSVPITSSSVRTVDRIKIRARNVNGVGSYIENTTNINVHTAAQSGFNESSISVSNSLGSNFTDNAIRSSAFKSETSDTPSLRGSSFNYYTTETFTEAADPGVAGTKEATVRLGLLKHDVTNYSTYIPAGPNRSSDTGTQYFTLAFRRAAMANFTVSINSTTGIEGMFIAAPGTTIDNTSGSNGWLNCGIQYAGAGVPGSNTGNGGNGSDGCASTGADVIGSGSLNGSFTFTLGTQNSTNADGNVILLRIALAANDTVTSLSIS